MKTNKQIYNMQTYIVYLIKYLQVSACKNNLFICS